MYVVSLDFHLFSSLFQNIGENVGKVYICIAKWLTRNRAINYIGFLKS